MATKSKVNINTIAIIGTIVLSLVFLGILVYSKKDKLTQNEEEVVGYAVELGLDESKFREDFKSDAIKNKVDGQKNDVMKRLDNNPSTPTVFIDGQKLTMSTYDDFESAIVSALEAKNNLENPVSYTGGGPLVYVEVFSDYNCPHCADFDPIVWEVEGRLGGVVQIDHKHLPFLKESSFMYAYAAEAAREQGKFREMDQLLFNKINNK